MSHGPEHFDAHNGDHQPPPSGAARRANRILFDGAREAYVGDDTSTPGVPIDRRCPACGVDRDGCASATCIRKEPAA